MKFSTLTKVFAAGAIAVAGLAISGTPGQAAPRGFYCNEQTVETTLGKGDGTQQVWIRWRSRDFESSGYNPRRRCQEVSARLENYRASNRLNFITLGRINGQNVICTASQPGVCTGLIYTLQPDEKDPIGALQAFVAWRTQSADARTRPESGSDSVPMIDVSPGLAESTNSATDSEPANVSPQREQPRDVQPQQPSDGGGNGGGPEL